MTVDDYDFLSVEMCYFRVLVSVGLCSIQDGHNTLTEAGREVYGGWTFLPTMYEQLTLDAFNVMPPFIHGILAIDLRRQKILEAEHPRSFRIRKSLFPIVYAFQILVRKRRVYRPIGLQGKYYFHSIIDQLSLERFRYLIWESPRNWDNYGQKIVGLDWPALEEGVGARGIKDPCPFCDAPASQSIGHFANLNIKSLSQNARLNNNVIRICPRHEMVVRVPLHADPYRRSHHQ
jgi:hypothetical protein